MRLAIKPQTAHGALRHRRNVGIFSPHNDRHVLLARPFPWVNVILSVILQEKMHSECASVALPFCCVLPLALPLHPPTLAYGRPSARL